MVKQILHLLQKMIKHSLKIALPPTEKNTKPILLYHYITKQKYQIKRNDAKIYKRKVNVSNQLHVR